MKKTLGLSAAALLTAASLAACGSGSDYCDTYKESKEELGDFDVSQGADYDKMQSYIDQLRDAAPEDDLEQAWDTAGETFSKIDKELDDIGLSFDDLGDLQNIEGTDDLPKGVSMQDMQKFVGNMQKIMSEDDMDDAMQTIKDYGKENCDTKS